MKAAVTSLVVCCTISVALSIRLLGDKKSVVVPNNPLRSSWDCHPGCEKFCLPSCKQSCCAPNAPDYNPAMYPQLLSYQAAMANPPPPPQACASSCPSSCFPSCDAGCCAQASAPVPQTYGPNPYGSEAVSQGYVDPYDPYGSQGGCSAQCAPQYTPDCCRSQALNLKIRPSYLPGYSKKVGTSADRPKASHSKDNPKPSHAAESHKKKPQKLADRHVCVPACQKLCKPICQFECCLPTHKFADPKPKPKPKPAPKPAAPRPAPRPAPPPRDYHVRRPAPPPRGYHVRRPAAPRANYQVQRPAALPQSAGYYGATTASPCGGQSPCGSEAPTQGQASLYGLASTNPYAVAQQAAAPAMCPGACPNSCAPSCAQTCCAPQAAFWPPQPRAYSAPLPGPPPTPRLPGSPGLAPLRTTCPGATCPNACAPMCTPSCCMGTVMLPPNWDKRNRLYRTG